MGNWQIAKTTSAASRCRLCDRAIDAGDWKFGQSTPKSRWFHLRCAAEGAPVVFPPFEAEAKKLLSASKSAAKQRAFTVPREVEKALSSGRNGLHVFADWLQTNEDPWGTLIALALAGKEDAARRHLNQHAESLLGPFRFRRYDWSWRDGLVVAAVLKGTEAALLEQLGDIPSTRTMSRLQRLRLEGPHVNRAVLQAVSKLAPKSLEGLSFTISQPGLAALSLPNLKRLRVQLNANSAAELLDAEVPALEVLQLEWEHRKNAVFPASFIQQLVRSKLLKQLRRLDLHGDHVLDDAGLQQLLSHRDALSHLEAMHLAVVVQPRFGKESPQVTAVKKAFAALHANALEEDDDDDDESDDDEFL